MTRINTSLLLLALSSAAWTPPECRLEGGEEVLSRTQFPPADSPVESARDLTVDPDSGDLVILDADGSLYSLDGELLGAVPELEAGQSVMKVAAMGGGRFAVGVSFGDDLIYDASTGAVSPWPRTDTGEELGETLDLAWDAERQELVRSECIENGDGCDPRIQRFDADGALVEELPGSQRLYLMEAAAGQLLGIEDCTLSVGGSPSDLTPLFGLGPHDLYEADAFAWDAEGRSASLRVGDELVRVAVP